MRLSTGSYALFVCLCPRSESIRRRIRLTISGPLSRTILVLYLGPMAQHSSSKKRRSHEKASQHATKERQATFIEAFAIYGNIVRACVEINIPRRTVYNWKAKGEDGKHLDPEFMKLYEVARKEAVAVLEAEAWRRAVDGESTPITVAGEREEVDKKSDTLLIFLLKAHAPEKYRDRYDVNLGGKVEHVGQVTLYMPDNGRGPG